jgi:hypothetical protein
MCYMLFRSVQITLREKVANATKVCRSCIIHEMTMLFAEECDYTTTQSDNERENPFKQLRAV